MANTNANEHHTPINLAPGIDLLVRADLVGDAETERLVEKCQDLLNREVHVRAIQHAIDKWSTAEDEDALSSVLEMLGWIDNRANRSAKDLASAARALLDIAPTSDLIVCADHCFELQVAESAVNS